MKKLIAIALLSIYLFNLAGYILLFQYLGYLSDKKLLASIEDARFPEQNLIEIKVPLHLPYSTDWNDFERIDGEIEISGMYYKYVKRKLSGDTLYLLCLPHAEKTQMQMVKNEFACAVNDLPVGNDLQNNLVKKANTFSEFKQDFIQFSFSLPFIPKPGKFLFVPVYYDQVQVKENWQPPELL